MFWGYPANPVIFWPRASQGLEKGRVATTRALSLGSEPREGVWELQLELSSEGRYALRALLYLARTDSQVTADKISAEASIPRRLLARIMARL